MGELLSSTLTFCKIHTVVVDLYFTDSFHTSPTSLDLLDLLILVLKEGSFAGWVLFFIEPLD